jgi:hypothetical protein
LNSFLAVLNLNTQNCFKIDISASGFVSFGILLKEIGGGLYSGLIE